MPEVAAQRDLRGREVVITRPAGTSAVLARRVRAAGGVPVLLPGMALRQIDDDLTRHALKHALSATRIVFTSPAAVRHAVALQALPPGRAAIAVGQGTARALGRAGVAGVLVPTRQDSEGVLALPLLQNVQGVRVALIGAAGGREVLSGMLAVRGALLDSVHVYQRVAARIDRRHVDAVLGLSPGACVLWSSAEAITRLQQQLPADAWAQLCQATAVVSSARLREAAQAAGFAHGVQAQSAMPEDLLAAACLTRDFTHRGYGPDQSRW